MIKTDLCPDPQTLQQYLLGKIHGPERAALDEHLLQCDQCAGAAETVVSDDDLTKLALGAEPPEDEDPEAMQQLIQRIKQARHQLETIRVGETLPGTPPESSATDTSTESAMALTFLAPAQAPDELGRLGDYRVLEVIGMGGMGLVLRAEDIKLRRQVALKTMKPSIAERPAAKVRFMREAQATAALEHDHIVPIYQVGEDRGVPFIAMQYLRGESLGSRLDRQGKLSAAEMVRIGKEVASGLALAHESGMIHRDIKPDNIWLDEKTDRAKILDFGLVSASGDDEGLTHSGAVLGTPRYMSPEQALAHPIDHRCDLFSLGCVLYHCAAGHAPFSGNNFTSTLIAVAHQPPVPLQQAAPELRADVAAAIMQLLAKDPDHRPLTAEAVVHQFRELADKLKRIQPDLGDTVTQTSGLSPIVTQTSGLSSLPPQTQPGGLCDIPSSNRRPPHRRWPVLASFGGFAAVVLGVIIITIKNPDGTVTKLEVAEGATVQIEHKPHPESHPAAKDTTTTLAAESNIIEKEYALKFSGGQGVEIPSLILPTDSPLTIEATIVCEVNKSNGIGLARIAGSSYQFDVYSGSREELTMGGNYLDIGIHRAGIGLDAIHGQVARIAAVRATNELRLFVNGRCVKRTPVNGNLHPPTHPFNVGENFVGTIDELRISSIDRYDDDYTLSRRLDSDEHTLALYHFDEGSGNMLRDSSSNNHHGKIFSGKWIEVEPTKYDKDGPLLAGAKPILIEPGAPLGPRANVQRPAAIPGLRSWSVEPVGINNPYLPVIAWHPSGDSFVTYESSGLLRVWDKDGEIQQLIFAHDNSSNNSLNAAFIDDGNLFATLSLEGDKTIRIWETTTWKCVREFPYPRTYYQAKSMAWSSITQRLAVSGAAGILLINPLTGQTRQRKLGDAGKEYQAVAFTRDGSTLIVAVGTSLIWLDADTLNTLQSVELRLDSSENSFYPFYLTCSPDGRWVACSSSNGIVWVFDAQTSELRETFKTGSFATYSLQWFNDSRRIAVASSRGPMVSVWDITQPEQALVKSGWGTSYGMGISPDEKEIVFLKWEGELLSLNLESRLTRRFINNDGLMSRSVSSSISRQGDRVADLYQNVLTLWDSDTGQPLKRHGQMPSSNRIDWSPTGEQVALSKSDTLTKNLTLVDIASRKITDLTSPERKIRSTAWSPDGTKFAISGDDQPIEILNPNTGEVLLQFPGESKHSFSLAWSPDNQYLAAWTTDGVVNVWDTNTATHKASAREFKDAPFLERWDTSLAWMPGNHRLCIKLRSGVTIWDIETSEQSPVDYFPFLFPSRRLAVGSNGSSFLVTDENSSTFWRGENRDNRRFLGFIGWVNDWHSDIRRAFFWGPYGQGTGIAYDTQTFQKLGTSLRHFPDGGWITVGPDGHYRGGLLAPPGEPQGDGTTPEELAAIEKHIVYTTMHEDGSRATYTPAQFREKFNWKNDPNKATLMALPE